MVSSKIVAQVEQIDYIFLFSNNGKVWSSVVPFIGAESVYVILIIPEGLERAFYYQMP
jgi:hypothetical protein